MTLKIYSKATAIFQKVRSIRSSNFLSQDMTVLGPPPDRMAGFYAVIDSPTAPGGKGHGGVSSPARHWMGLTRTGIFRVSLGCARSPSGPGCSVDRGHYGLFPRSRGLAF